MNGWSEAVKQVMPHVVKIELPDSHGSGFLIAYCNAGRNRQYVVIATAAHVVRHAAKWEVPCRIHYQGQELVLKPEQRAMGLFGNEDVGVIQFDPGDLKLPSQALTVLDRKTVLQPGYPLGWCGFPNIMDWHNCFFAGHVSTPVAGSEGDYLVDGVVIHGVSGSPAFAVMDGKVVLVGLVSAYYPNRATGEALPGMGLVQSIQPIVDFFVQANKRARKEPRHGKAKSKPRSGDRT